MRIAIIGPGHIGGNVAARLALAGHEVAVAFSRDEQGLRALAEEIGGRAASPREATAWAEVVVISVPWGAIPAALEAVGPLTGKVVIDTTNQFGPGPHPAAGQTAAAFNAERMAGGRYTKSFNTLTAAFQRAAADRPPDTKVVQWLCGDDAAARDLVAGLIEDAGYVPVDLGGVAECTAMEAPRRPGAVYGEEWRLPEARAVAAAVRAGNPIPPTPSYQVVTR